MGVKTWERQGLYGVGYESVLLRTSSAEALLPLAPHIFRAFRDITEESPPQPARPQALLFATSTLEQQGSAGVPGARAVADLWSGLCQAHQSLPLRGASNGS